MKLCKKPTLSLLALLSMINFLFLSLTPVLSSDTPEIEIEAEKHTCSEYVAETPKEKEFLTCLQDALLAAPNSDTTTPSTTPSTTTSTTPSTPVKTVKDSRRKRSTDNTDATDNDPVVSMPNPTLTVSSHLLKVTTCVYNLTAKPRINEEGLPLPQEEISPKLFCKGREKIRGCIKYLLTQYNANEKNTSKSQNDMSTLPKLFDIYDTTLQCNKEQSDAVKTSKEALVLQLSSSTRWFTPNLAILFNDNSTFTYLQTVTDVCLLDRLKDLVQEKKPLAENPFKFLCQYRQKLTECYKKQAILYDRILKINTTNVSDSVSFTDRLTETVCNEIWDIDTIIEQLTAEKNCFDSLKEPIMKCTAKVNYADTEGKIYTSSTCRDFQATKDCYEEVYSKNCTESKNDQGIRNILTEIADSTTSLCGNKITEEIQSRQIPIEEPVLIKVTRENETSVSPERITHSQSKIKVTVNSVNFLKCNIPILATFVLFLHFYSVVIKF